MTESNGRILYVDLVGGIAGDMLLAALLDAGASMEAVQRSVFQAGLHHVQLKRVPMRSAGLRALRIEVWVDGCLADQPQPSTNAHLALSEDGHVAHGPHRSYGSIRAQLVEAELAPPVKKIALDAFLLLAKAESSAHGVPLEDVHFHEVGSDDAIADIVGVAAAIVDLDIDKVVASPVPVGGGTTVGAHGTIPLPAMATLHLLRGAPLVESGLTGEMVTPTGAALLRVLAERFDGVPGMTLEAVGIGGGRRAWPDRPNIVRALVGRESRPAPASSDEDCIVEANIDDMNPEHFKSLRAAITAAGALDVWSHTIHMKKDRLGTMVSALVRKTLKDAVVHAFFMHSTTLGVRVYGVDRVRTARRSERVSTVFGPVVVKIATRPDGPPLVTPEYDDCERIAQERSIPVRLVFEAALKASWES